MEATPPLPPVTPSVPPLTPQDSDQLRMLAIGHYVVAAITGLFSLIFILHVVMGLAIVNGALPMETGDGPPPPFAPQNMGWIFVIMGGAVVLGGLTLAGFMAYAGRCLIQRRRHTLCLVVAGLSCLVTPIGTILGVFSLVVLLRPQVRQAFLSNAVA